MKILIVDSHNDQRPDARLPRVLAALGRFGLEAESFRSVRRPSDGGFHDLAEYDLALVHESDARLDNGAFYKACFRAATACVLFSGGTDRASAESARLLILPDRDVIGHAEEGILFWQRTGRLDLTAWTQGLGAAARAEVHRLAEPLRKALRGGKGLGPEEREALVRLPDDLRSWCGSETGCQALQELSIALDRFPRKGQDAQTAWVEANRELLTSLFRQVVAEAR